MSAQIEHAPGALRAEWCWPAAASPPAGRWPIEVDPGYRGHGLGRALASAARHLVPGDRPVWAQIAPANAASVRTFLAAGFRPVGAEALLTHSELGV